MLTKMSNCIGCLYQTTCCWRTCYRHYFACGYKEKNSKDFLKVGAVDFLGNPEELLYVLVADNIWTLSVIRTHRVNYNWQLAIDDTRINPDPKIVLFYGFKIVRISNSIPAESTMTTGQWVHFSLAHLFQYNNHAYHPISNAVHWTFQK